MSYRRRAVPLRGLGYDFTADLGVKTVTFKIPVEKLVNDTANLTLNTLKSGMNQAADMAVGALKKQMPTIAEAASNELQKQAPKIAGTLMPVLQKQVLPPLLQQVSDTAVNQLWPELQPKVRNEVIFAGIVLAAAMVLPLAGATLYLRREIRRSKS